MPITKYIHIHIVILQIKEFQKEMEVELLAGKIGIR